MALTPYATAAIVSLGHVALWIWLYNRLHASSLPSRAVRHLEKWTIFVAVATCGWLLLGLLGPPRETAVDGAWTTWLARLWCGICVLMLAYVVTAWCVRRWHHPSGHCLVHNDTTRIRVADVLGHAPIGRMVTRLCAALPGNEILEIHAQHKIIRLARLPHALAGLRIAQITDLHLTGQLTPEFFQLAVEHVNRWEPDAVMITGDLVDKAPCVAWIPATLGRLRARYGVYAILGNHDQRLADVPTLRKAVAASGIHDLGGRTMTCRMRDVPVLLAGNECPWFPPAPPWVPCTDADRPFSILLSHSPDQLPWARRCGVDLMLAGHTHGGQIRLPVVGPIICPSRYGVRYASGLFAEPPTLLHVSRGLAGVQPLRWGCPPELTLLELQPNG
jgi:hypothetical protein